MRSGFSSVVLAGGAALALGGCEQWAVVASHTDSGGSSMNGGETVDESEGALLDVYLGDCAPPTPPSCDEGASDPLHVVGLDCPGGIPTAGAITAPPGAIGTHAGALGPYEVREGEQFLILSTGIASHLPLVGDALAAVCDEPSLDFCPSTSHAQGPMSDLPAPLSIDPVDDELTCAQDPSLVGHGDCSNTLYDQLTACGGPCEIEDYVELRLSLTVPAQVYGLAFDFAFMSVEWPEGDNSAFNDMFVAWLESDAWTGNVSFDGEGNPITVKSSFRDYTGDDLDGFAMAGQAGTRWLTTDFGVLPGETIELVLAVFDVTDDAIDSVVLLDGFRWTCSGATPMTTPVP